MVRPLPTITILALALAAACTWLLARPLGLARAVACAAALVTCVVSLAGLVLLDAKALRAPHLQVLVIVLGALLLAGLGLARRRWLDVDERRGGGHTNAPGERRAHPPDRRVWLALAIVVVTGVGLRLDPSPYLHGGQDQGLYVSVGHLIARTGQHRATDRVMAGKVRGIEPQWILDAHRIASVETGSSLDGVREGRWIAGIHVEDASEGRVVPAFFHLLPVWFAISELDWGFARSTWPLVWFAACSHLAIFAVVATFARRIGAATGGVDAHWYGVIAAAALGFHPLDLWISTFTVTENAARPALLASVAFALLASDAEREGTRGPQLYAVLGGLVFTLGAFARGSMIALGVFAIAALIVTPSRTPRTRRTLVVTLTFGTALAIVQGIWHSWPYFFSAATSHFFVPVIQPFQGEATVWTAVGVAAVIGADSLIQRLRPRLISDELTSHLVRVGAGLLMLLALGLVTYRFAVAPHEVGPAGTFARAQQVITVLVRHGGAGGVILGLTGVAVGVWKANDRELPWVALGAAIVFVTVLKPGVRYEFYYARYLVGDAIPVLLVGAAVLLALACSSWRASPYRKALLAVAVAAWVLPPMVALRHPVYWHRDLARSPEEQAEILESIPENAVIVFDHRMPGRWRGVLATPFFLAYGRNVLVYPHRRMIEGAISAGTPVFLISGGWEGTDHQEWSGWHTTVVSRGVYEARRAAVVEGAAPTDFEEWGGPWEVQRIDPSIFRDNGAFSLHRGSRFVTHDEPGLVRSAPVASKWQPGAFVEFRASERALRGCALRSRLLEAAVELPPPSMPKPNTWRFALPEPPRSPTMEGIEVTWRCDDATVLPSVAWHRVSLRWEASPSTGRE